MGASFADMRCRGCELHEDPIQDIGSILIKDLESAQFQSRILSRVTKIPVRLHRCFQAFDVVNWPCKSEFTLEGLVDSIEDILKMNLLVYK